jgi:pyruvate formate lyase activating enzyme
LKGAKILGIHTCIETSGFAALEHIKKISSFVDLFLYDYKETDPEKHKDFTGVTNELILSNLENLCNSGSSVIMRCPIIPGLNDTEGHFRGIALVSKKYPQLKGIEIMAYHDLGRSKAVRIGKEYNVSATTVCDERKAEWIAALKSLGCENVY